MEKGYLALVLHAHLPYVRHPEHEFFLEEDWLYEAITETYIPLIDVFEGLIHDRVPFRITMSLTPPLISMLLDPLLQERYLKRLDSLIELAEKEIDRTRWQAEFNHLAHMYRARLWRCREVFVDIYDGNLVTAFKKLQDTGVLEIITCGATHAFFPLYDNIPQAIRAQIAIAVDQYQKIFERQPKGIWLPECGFVPGQDRFLAEYGIQYFITDTHGILHAKPRPKYGIYAPLYCRSGVAAFGRDMESSKQVWSAQEGYPGDYYYREFYRDIGFDLDFDYIKPYIQPNGLRKHTGFKYYKITGRTADKQPYNEWIAKEKAAEHAANFMFNREKQIEYVASIIDRQPMIISPYDAELYGHWWFEGPDWLNFLIRKTAYDQNVFSLITPGDYLQRYPKNQVATPSMSSWGYKGYSEVWLEGSNDWIYRHLHKASERMCELARNYSNTDGVRRRALNQAARELVLAQSSDWAFIMKTGTMVPYAVKRTKDHVGRFTDLYNQIRSDKIDEGFLGWLEWVDNIFPDIDYTVYLDRPVAVHEILDAI